MHKGAWCSVRKKSYQNVIRGVIKRLTVVEKVLSTMLVLALGFLVFIQQFIFLPSFSVEETVKL